MCEKGGGGGQILWFRFYSLNRTFVVAWELFFRLNLDLTNSFSFFIMKLPGWPGLVDSIRAVRKVS